jgi:hypothetical protein
MDPEPKAILEETCVLVREGEKPQCQFDCIASSIYSGHHFTSVGNCRYRTLAEQSHPIQFLVYSSHGLR